MDLLNIPVFRVMTERMAWLTQRQQVLAHNVANADTPGFKPSDVAQPDFERLLRDTGNRMAVRATRTGHMTGTAPQAPAGRVEEVTSGGSQPTGNSVVLEEEMMKVADTQVQYQITTNLYRKHVALIRTALGKP
jgi:flagellar basal-body rod protein FlgB